MTSATQGRPSRQAASRSGRPNTLRYSSTFPLARSHTGTGSKSEPSGSAKTVNRVAYDSPTYDGPTVTGIGRDKAVAIWYRALSTYFTSTTDYAGARTGTLNAAKDLYGSGSTEYNAVAAAWSAVNVK